MNDRLPQPKLPKPPCSMAQYHGNPYRYCPECDWREATPKPELNLSDLQVEAIRGVLEEVLTTSGSAQPAAWGPWLLGQLSRILDMQHALDVMAVLHDQEEKRGGGLT